MFKAQTIFEFKKPSSEEDFRKKLFGYGNKPNTKAWKLLKFIGSKGEEGAKLKEIQEYIYFEINKAPFGKDWFYEKDPTWNFKDKEIFLRRSRGYWNSQLYGTYRQAGLLNKYCHKNKNRKWVLTRMPKPGENIYEDHKAKEVKDFLK